MNKHYLVYGIIKFDKYPCRRIISYSIKQKEGKII